MKEYSRKFVYKVQIFLNLEESDIRGKKVEIHILSNLCNTRMVHVFTNITLNYFITLLQRTLSLLFNVGGN